MCVCVCVCGGVRLCLCGFPHGDLLLRAKHIQETQWRAMPQFFVGKHFSWLTSCGENLILDLGRVGALFGKDIDYPQSSRTIT